MSEPRFIKQGQRDFACQRDFNVRRDVNVQCDLDVKHGGLLLLASVQLLLLHVKSLQADTPVEHGNVKSPSPLNIPC